LKSIPNFFAPSHHRPACTLRNGFAPFQSCENRKPFQRGLKQKKKSVADETKKKSLKRKEKERRKRQS
jgi:hypothetical protein